MDFKKIVFGYIYTIFLGFNYFSIGLCNIFFHKNLWGEKKSNSFMRRVNQHSLDASSGFNIDFAIRSLGLLISLLVISILLFVLKIDASDGIPFILIIFGTFVIVAIFDRQVLIPEAYLSYFSVFNSWSKKKKITGFLVSFFSFLVRCFPIFSKFICR